MRELGYGLLSVVVMAALALLVLWTPDTDEQRMHSKYRTASSSFAEGPAGMQIHYTDQGCRRCPVIVFLHGGNASLHTFQPLAEVLSAQYRIITYDQPGHGLTGPHPNDYYSAQAYISALSDVIEHTGVEKFSLAGNSMGGWIAWRYALAYPERVSRLILLDSAGAPRAADAEKPQLYLGARLIRNPLARRIGQYITPRAVIKQSLLDTVADESLVTDTLIDRYWELLRYPGNRRAVRIRSTIDRDAHYGEQLSKLSVPTLILWGQEDRVTPLYDADTFHSMIPNSRKVVLPNVAHVPMEEAPQQTAEAIAEFLAGRG